MAIITNGLIKSELIYSPQNFVDLLTDKCYIFTGENVIEQIHKLLKENGVESEDLPLWDYPLSDVEHIVENAIPVVLVDVSGFDADGEWKTEFRWFEIPAHHKCEGEI